MRQGPHVPATMCPGLRAEPRVQCQLRRDHVVVEAARRADLHEDPIDFTTLQAAILQGRLERAVVHLAQAPVAELPVAYGPDADDRSIWVAPYHVAFPDPESPTNPLSRSTRSVSAPR